MILSALAAAVVANWQAPVAQAQTTIPLPLSSNDTAPIAAAETLGKLLLEYDRAAWTTTDMLVAKLPPDQLNLIRGWVVEPRAAGGLTATYFAGEPGAYRAVFVASSGTGASEESRLLKDEPLTPAQARLASAVTAARAYAGEKGLRPCTPAPFNTVALPPEAASGPIRVYLLSAPTEKGRLPFGGHYRLSVDPAGRVVAERSFTKACLTLDQPATAAVVTVSHLLDPIPTEIHVFMSLSAQLPVAVATLDGRVWIVEGTHIRLMEQASKAGTQ